MDCTISGPKLISGTNVKFGISILGKNGRIPKDIQVTIRGFTPENPSEPPTTIYSTDSLSENMSPFVNLLVNLDSTHFQPSAVLTIAVHAMDDRSQPLDSTFTTTVYNRFEKLYSDEFK